jgi:hypothetical protein
MANNIRYRFFYNAYLGLEVLAANPTPDHYPGMDGYKFGDPLALAYEGTISVNAYGDPKGVNGYVCNQLFRLFNAPWARPNEYAGPSMSVGDVVVLHPDTPQAAAFKVETVGFSPIRLADFGKIVPQPAFWLRKGDLLREYLVAKQGDGITLTDAEESIVYGA